MKVRDVPQDAGSCLDQAGHQRVNDAVRDDGRYEPVPTVGWQAEIDATAVSAEFERARIRTAWEEARAGRQSPLAYHMVAASMDVGLLATEARLWAWQVRRHLRPDVFARLKAADLARYAGALGLSVEQLRGLPDAPEPL